jgi:hypothetical protein
VPKPDRQSVPKTKGKPESPGKSGQAKGKQDKASRAKKGPQAKRVKPHVHGIVMAVGFEPDTLDLRVKGKAVSYDVSMDAVVSLNKTEAEFGDLLEGDNVFLVLDEVGVVVHVDARREELEVEEPELEEPELDPELEDDLEDLEV